MTNAIFFDSGTIISLTIARLSWLLPHLRKHFNGPFYITPAVYKELVERPMEIHRYEFEALQVMKLVREGTLQVYTKVPIRQVKELTKLVNTSVTLNGKNIDLMQEGEMQSLACVLENPGAVLAMDERTLRYLIEDEAELISLLRERFQKEVDSNKAQLQQCAKVFRDVKIIRSTELVGVAYSLGLLKEYVPVQKDGDVVLLDAVMWAVKYGGCAVTALEIEQLKKDILARAGVTKS